MIWFADMNDPIGEVLKRTEFADGLILEKTTCPLGVLLIVFEARPEALFQLIYTNSGVAILALASNAVHKLRKWQRIERNSTGKETT